MDLLPDSVEGWFGAADAQSLTAMHERLRGLVLVREGRVIESYPQK
jgi:hypothetical protein